MRLELRELYIDVCVDGIVVIYNRVWNYISVGYFLWVVGNKVIN